LGDAAEQGAQPQLSQDNPNDPSSDHDQLEDQSFAGENTSEGLAGGATHGSGDLNSPDSLSAREDQASQTENQYSESASDIADQPSDLMQSQVQEQIAKAYQEGLEKGAEQAREKAQVQESLREEMALKDKQTMAEQFAEQERLLQAQREKERAEYEQEIQSLKDKIKSFDESLLGELEKKKEQLEAQMQPRVELMTQLCDQLKALTQDAQSCFEPLKRLSVHIAEQLVLGELSVSPSAVERLIRRCTDDLDVRDASVIKVEINALDKVTLEKTLPPSMNAIELRVSPDLQVGSVRVLVNDTQVEDLIQNRLDAMASRLLGQPKLWREKSTLMKDPITEAYFQAQPEPLEPMAQPPGVALEDSKALIQDDELMGAQASEHSASSLEGTHVSETNELIQPNEPNEPIGPIDHTQTHDPLEPEQGV
jgi:flagellar biosynthesis/type III secretory pathway protein FliH